MLCACNKHFQSYSGCCMCELAYLYVYRVRCCACNTQVLSYVVYFAYVSCIYPYVGFEVQAEPRSITHLRVYEKELERAFVLLN